MLIIFVALFLMPMLLLGAYLSITYLRLLALPHSF